MKKRWPTEAAAAAAPKKKTDADGHPQYPYKITNDDRIFEITIPNGHRVQVELFERPGHEGQVCIRSASGCLHLVMDASNSLYVQPLRF